MKHPAKKITALIVVNYFKNKLIKLLEGDNNCVRLELIQNELSIETGTFRFDLLIINNSNNQIRLERLYLKTGQEVRPVYIHVPHARKNPSEEKSKWIPFDNTYLMNKILYSVNSPGSRKIEEVGLFDNFIGIKNVATPIPKCKVDNIKDAKDVEIVLEYVIMNKNEEVALLKKYIVL